jgi:sugar/nucleoside kinase (ribokinase family)
MSVFKKRSSLAPKGPGPDQDGLDIVVLGARFADLVFSGLDRMPGLGEELHYPGFSLRAGGAFNALLAFRRLGLRVAWAVDFGNDLFSRFVRERALAIGIDPTFFVDHDRPMVSVTCAVVLGQERTFISHCDPEPTVSAPYRALTAETRAFFVPGLVGDLPFRVASALVRARGALVLMDGNEPESLAASGADAIRGALGACDMFLPNEREALILAGVGDAEAALEKLAAYCPRVAIKLGERGLIAAWEGERYALPSLSIAARDSTGAGDAFDAALLAAILEGRGTEEALARAAAAGALTASSDDEERSALTAEAIGEGAADILRRRRRA